MAKPGRPKGSGRGLVQYNLRVEEDIYQAIQAESKKQGVSPAEFGRISLRKVFEDGGILEAITADMKGYEEGVRRGQRESREAISEALSAQWEKTR